MSRQIMIFYEENQKKIKLVARLVQRANSKRSVGSEQEDYMQKKHVFFLHIVGMKSPISMPNYH